MKPIRNLLEGIVSIDWSKRLANLFGFLSAIAVFIAWPFLPIPALHHVVYNVDLAGTLPTVAACAISAAFLLGKERQKAAGLLVSFIGYALLVATVLIFASILFSIPLILVPGGVNLDIVLLLVSLVAFFRIGGARGFWELFSALFFIVGIPLLLVDIYFGFAISVTAHIPYDSLILGGGGLRDGLNKMFFMILAFVFVYHLLIVRYGEKIEAMGIKYFGSHEGLEGAGVASTG